jgi:hypothetical protein
MELGLFWLLAEKPLSASGAAASLNIPPNRCHQNGLEKRINYLAADLLQDDLPIGFDMVMLCDLGLFGEMLFRKIHDALNMNGHLVVVDRFAPTKTDAPPSRLSGAFLTSLQYPAQSISFTTVEMVQSRLQETGFEMFP